MRIFFDLGADQVAQGPQRQAQVFVDHAGGGDGLDLRGDLVPKPAQVADVHEDLIGPGPFGGGAQDEPTGFLDTFFFHAVADHLLEALALGFVFDLQGNADMGGARHVHQVARRNRQLRGQARALGADGVLGDLHHQALAFMHQRADVLHGRPFAHGNFRRVDECRAVQADVDEGRLHARQHPYHLAFVDIADDATLLRALDVDLLQNTVFNHRHARFHRRDVDQDLFTHGRVSFRHVHDYGRIKSDGAQRAFKVCQQGMPKWPSSSAVSHSGRPTTAE